MSEVKIRFARCGGTVSPIRSPCNLCLRFTPDFQNTQGIIFVVDSNDRERVVEAREELQRMLNEDELRDALLLVFANKQDLPNAMNAAEITDKLGLHGLKQRTWYIQVRLGFNYVNCPLILMSTNRQRVRRVVMACMKGLNGSAQTLKRVGKLCV